MQRLLKEAQQATQINIVSDVPKQALATPVMTPKGIEATQPKLNPFFIEEEPTGQKTVQQILNTIALGKVNLRQFEG